MKTLRLAVLTTLALAGCGVDTSGISSLTGDATSGASLYAANCQSCHGTSGSQGAATTAKASVDEAASVILTGKEEMKSFSGTLSNQQIADIIAYLRTK